MKFFLYTRAIFDPPASVTPRRISGHSHDALHRTILSEVVAHVISHLNVDKMDAVRLVPCSERPFNVSKLLYLHCIDLETKKFTPVSSFPCLEVLCVLGHFSFPSELAVRRLCCFLWSVESEGKLSAAQSPVLLNVKSSCYFTVSILIVFLLR